VKYQILVLAVFLLVLCTSVIGQQTTLIVQDDRHDPCRRFKMRVLVPEDTAKQIAERTPQNTIDPGIVWNPCVTNSVEIASVFPVIPLKDNFVVINLNDGQPKLETRQIQPAPTTTSAPRKSRSKKRHD
jgi:hypothetical protein